MSTDTPADAVREALPDEREQLAAALDRVAASYTDCRIKRDVERAAAMLRSDRLAALAGAAPVAWLYRFPFNETEGTDYCISPTRFLPSWVESRGATETPLFPHAPAKAREVTEADVERACKAAYEDAMRESEHADETWEIVTARRDMSDTVADFRSSMRAALATFAEGE